MRCLFACFSVSKDKKHQHLLDGASSNHQKNEANEAVPINSITLKKEKLGELLNGKKKVTFDLNVKTHESSDNKLLRNNEDKEKIEETEEKSKEITRSSVPYLTANNSDVVCKSQNNRYQNIAESEDEIEDLDLGTGDLDDDDDETEAELVMDESSESLFSLSIESRKQVCEVESGEKEVTSAMPVDKSPTDQEPKKIGLNRNAVQSVLNPVENVDQWREAKSKAEVEAKASIIQLKDEEKENINVLGFDEGIPISPEPSFRVSKLYSNDKNVVLVGQETAVDTSLSSWLVEPEKRPNSKTSSTDSVGNSASKKTSSSPRSHVDRPILGALTMGEHNQQPPRKCRSQSPDETPIVGTVGSYWCHTGQRMDSDSSSASKGTPRTRSGNIKKVRANLNPIPFEATLDEGIAGGV